MIYEVRTYQLKPRSVPEFIDTFGRALPVREKVSKLSGFFYTEIGPLNEVIHVWPFKDLGDRERKRALFPPEKKLGWPPKVAHLAETMNSEIFVPAPFSPTMAEGSLGPIFEWREYQILPGMMPEVYRNWEKKVARRIELSPLIMAMHSEIGGLFKLVHIWGYESLEHRSAVRAEAVAKGIWPPKGPKETLVSQRNKIVLAAPFSPVR